MENTEQEHGRPNFEILLIDKEALASSIKSAANWFIWIGALSLLNSLINMSNDVPISFIGGLALSHVVDGMVIGMYGEYDRMALLINAAIAIVFVIIALKARQASKAAFITGLVIYTIDACIYGYFQEWQGFIFHIVAFYFILKGFRLINAYGEVEEQLMSGAIVTDLEDPARDQ